MYNHDIEPDAVITIGDLLAKLEMILSGARQLAAENDPELERAISLRVEEVVSAMGTVQGTKLHWDEVSLKMEAISDAMRQRDINELNAMYAINA